MTDDDGDGDGDGDDDDDGDGDDDGDDDDDDDVVDIRTSIWPNSNSIGIYSIKTLSWLWDFCGRCTWSSGMYPTT